MASNLRFTVFVVLSTVIIFSFLVNGDDDKPIAPQKPTTKNNTKTCSAEIASSKTGSCPEPAKNLRCFVCNDNCKSDADCSDENKCCPQPGCGNSCKSPISQ